MSFQTKLSVCYDIFLRSSYNPIVDVEPNLKQVVNKEKYEQKHLKQGKENRETKSNLSITPLYFD